MKSILLYIIIMSMITIIKPYHFYYDTNCTKLKKWDLYKETGNVHDLCNFHMTSILLGLICYIISSYF